jgi:hypothetical protein
MKAQDSLPHSQTSYFSPARVRGWLVALGLVALVSILPAWACANLRYWDSKGPFKNLTQVVDLDQDGDLDVVVSHTRWEGVALSWAGVGRWINQGQGKFELVIEPNPDTFGGFAGGAGDVDQDGDADIFIQNFDVKLLLNLGRAQGGQAGKFSAYGGMGSGSPYTSYRDMGGWIVMGDLNGDGRVDAFVAGCCYGSNPARQQDTAGRAPSVWWVWINTVDVGGRQTGQTRCG